MDQRLKTSTPYEVRRFVKDNPQALSDPEYADWLETSYTAEQKKMLWAKWEIFQQAQPYIDGIVLARRIGKPVEMSDVELVTELLNKLIMQYGGTNGTR